MKLVGSLLFLSSTLSSATLLHTQESYEKDFVDHVESYGVKIESQDDYDERLRVYSENSDLIEAHNNGNHTSTLGHNQFSHLTFEEFESIYLSERVPRKESSRYVNAFEDVVAKDSVDWEGTGYVTSVKNQGSCGSCWAFSTTGGMEGAYYLKYGETVSFSEQQLVSCDTDTGDQGCDGGLMVNAFQYIAKAGLCAEDEYPYKSADGANPSCVEGCSPVEGTVGVTYTDVANDEDSLAKAVSQQPISVAVDADWRWQFYRGGVMSHVSNTNIDHGVLVVGYGSDGGNDYWKIKNSWGPQWGEGGFIRISRNVGQDDGPCGVTSTASYPTL